jgi:hypothetical protein
MIAQHPLLNEVAEVAEVVDAGVLRTTLTGELGSINAKKPPACPRPRRKRPHDRKTILSGFGDRAAGMPCT